MNALVQLRDCGQSPWYDYIQRSLITSGDLQTLIDQDGLMGITSNPSIFEKAIAGSQDYDAALAEAAQRLSNVKEIYETLAVRDIQDAADLMRSVYVATNARDGYVSLEVSPCLAFDTQGTIDEAVRLHKAVGRDNVMIKVPATAEGIPAIEHLLGLGININVTLLFSVDMYEQVAWAYIRGLEKFKASGGALNGVASVASFFVSRIDTLIDKQLDAKLQAGAPDAQRSVLEHLHGKVAVANAKIAYQKYLEVFAGERFQALRNQGAMVQRLLWASTGTKNPAYADTMYVDGLIGPDTVNTMPAATFSAFRDHGVVASTIEQDVDEARATMKQLADVGIDMNEVTDSLLRDGAKLFVDSFDQLMGVIAGKRREVLGDQLDRVSYVLGDHDAAVQEKIADYGTNDFVRRFWAKDVSLWHDDPAHQQIIRNAMGWLSITQEQLQYVSEFKELAEATKAAGFKHVLLLGMGGSSLCPEVLRMTYGVVGGYPELHVLDSTVPAQVQAFEQRVDLANTVCIVASKSGSTTEPLVFQKYFFERMRQVVGDQAGQHFIAVTDPGSLLEQMATELGFRHILAGVPEIGGRYSALSNFGIVPATLMGVDVEELLTRAERMRHSCDDAVPAAENLGVRLGAALGVLAKAGHDKLTFVTSPAIWDLGAWLEQLVAESTGKEGTGIIPVDGESLGAPEVYGHDRVFAYIRYTHDPCPDQDAKVAALEQAGHPVIRIDMADLMNLGQEFFLWEIATAVAGTVLGINAFDQPNVQESKDYTKAYLEEFKTTGALPEADAILQDEGIAVYADEANRSAVDCASLDDLVASHLARVSDGDYVAINAYIEHTPKANEVFQQLRVKVRDAKRVATTLGYGPRFLHSTGQLHKGGPNSGVFIQVTCDDPKDLAIPGEPYSFGVLKAAQALGDMKCLSTRDRRVIRVHLGADVERGLARLEQAVEAGLCVGKA